MNDSSMEQKDIMSHFERLYNKMATSKEPKYMQVFGSVMTCMMKDVADWNTEVAQGYLDKLEAINWCNYLSKKEAISIVANMEPKGGWDVSEWEKYVEDHDIRLEDSPYYNKWALYVTMNMIYSDSANSIAKIASKTLSEMSKEGLWNAIYMLALDKLKDRDGMFDIRSYFHV